MTNVDKTVAQTKNRQCNQVLLSMIALTLSQNKSCQFILSLNLLFDVLSTLTAYSK